MSEVELTLERRRGEEAVLRDANGRRWVLPTALVSSSTAHVSVHPARAAHPSTEDPVAAARAFLTHALSA